MQESQFDLIVICGGSGGSTLSTLVAIRGIRLALYPRVRIPMS